MISLLDGTSIALLRTATVLATTPRSALISWHRLQLEQDTFGSNWRWHCAAESSLSAAVPLLLLHLFLFQWQHQQQHW